MNDWMQPIATALAGAAAIATITWTVSRDRHPLTLVERLTTIAGNVRSEPIRRLIEDERDQRAARWVLERRAPRENPRRVRHHAVLPRIYRLAHLDCGRLH